MHKKFQLFHKEYYMALFPQILDFAIRNIQTKKMSAGRETKYDSEGLSSLRQS